MLYYFFAYKQVKDLLGGKDWVVAVPSGNFGNLTAGLYAHAMGLPVSKFVTANNANRMQKWPIFLTTRQKHSVSLVMLKMQELKYCRKKI